MKFAEEETSNHLQTHWKLSVIWVPQATRSSCFESLSKRATSDQKGLIPSGYACKMAVFNGKIIVNQCHSCSNWKKTHVIIRDNYSITHLLIPFAFWWFSRVFPSFSDFSDNTNPFSLTFRKALLQGKFVQDGFDGPGNLPQLTSGHGTRGYNYS